MADFSSEGDLVPRGEHPRPGFFRPEWRSLNGWWQFEVDRGDSGLERGLLARELGQRILVPFPPESAASGICDTDYMEAVWYRRTFMLPQGWSDRRVLLHFGAVDHDATVWVNGAEAVRHRGGFSSFTADITALLRRSGAEVLVVRARDPRDGPQARGKQSTSYQNSGCTYTRVTGIWQSVWLESVPHVHLRRSTVTPNLSESSFSVAFDVSANHPGYRIRAELSDASGRIAVGETRADRDRTPALTLAVPEGHVRPWSPQDPHLYGLAFTLLDEDGRETDRIESDTGLRSIAIDGDRLLLNGKPVFQRLVLDQGWWPETLMTAPSDDALRRDIELALSAGFNGARLHQKVFEERFFYHADRLGYLVWGEFGDWGANLRAPEGRNQHQSASFITQWLEVVQRDINHPSIIGWCPLNETDQLLHDGITVLDDVTRGMWLAARLADPTRPVLDSSGYSHRIAESDVWDSHDYEQDAGKLSRNQSGIAAGHPYRNRPEAGEFSLPYAGQPYFVSEFGGIWWDPDALDASGDDRSESWGYGDRVRDEEEFQRRFAALTGVLLENPRMFGYCYTQLTDVFQEQNGIYRFDRSPKLDLARIRASQGKRAAYEEAPGG